MITNNSSSPTPPPDGISLPIIHKINDLYKFFYSLKKNINKIDRHGIYQKADLVILEILELSIQAALSSSTIKINIVQSLRIKIEVIKRLIRIMLEVGSIENKKYFELESQLQEISKMASGWQKYLNNKES